MEQLGPLGECQLPAALRPDCREHPTLASQPLQGREEALHPAHLPRRGGPQAPRPPRPQPGLRPPGQPAIGRNHPPRRCPGHHLNASRTAAATPDRSHRSRRPHAPKQPARRATGNPPAGPRARRCRHRHGLPRPRRLAALRRTPRPHLGRPRPATRPRVRNGLDPEVEDRPNRQRRCRTHLRIHCSGTRPPQARQRQPRRPSIRFLIQNRHPPPQSRSSSRRDRSHQHLQPLPARGNGPRPRRLGHRHSRAHARRPMEDLGNRSSLHQALGRPPHPSGPIPQDPPPCGGAYGACS